MGSFYFVYVVCAKRAKELTWCAWDFVLRGLRTADWGLCSNPVCTLGRARTVFHHHSANSLVFRWEVQKRRNLSSKKNHMRITLIPLFLCMGLEAKIVGPYLRKGKLVRGYQTTSPLPRTKKSLGKGPRIPSEKSPYPSDIR